MSNTPIAFQDAKELLSNDGFAVGDVWYHGTSSALVAAIKKNGLRRLTRNSHVGSLVRRLEK